MCIYIHIHMHVHMQIQTHMKMQIHLHLQVHTQRWHGLGWRHPPSPTPENLKLKPLRKPLKPPESCFHAGPTRGRFTSNATLKWFFVFVFYFHFFFVLLFFFIL